MPLGFTCGVVVPFSFNMRESFQYNSYIQGFDFIACPLMDPDYDPKMEYEDESHTVNRLKPYAGSDITIPQGYWSSTYGIINPGLDLDSEDEVTRMDSETILKKQIEWASYLLIKACILPTPKGNSCANYAKCVKQILQGLKINMQLLLRLPLGTSDDDYIPGSKALDSWLTWNSFRQLCDHHSQLMVVLDIKRGLPPENSVKRWFGEPVTAAILDKDIFSTKSNTKSLGKRHQKLIAEFFDHDIQIIISGLKAPVDASAAGLKGHPLKPYQVCVSNIYDNLPDLSDNEHCEVSIRDVLELPTRAFRNYSQAASYASREEDKVKFFHYEMAISKALLQRIPNEKASVISTVLVVVGAGRGHLVRVSLQAAKTTGRKLRVYAVEKNPQTAIALDEMIRENSWSNIVSVVSSDVRDWNAPERADILVSDLLGSFGDNELSPESLDGAQRFLEKDGISIPSSYTSFLQPLTASNLYKHAQSRKQIVPSESACVVKIHNVARLVPSQQVFTFTHPKCSDKESNQRYQKLCFVIPNDTGSAMVHGFAGYFKATLITGVYFGTEPSKATKDMITWHPMFFPLRAPICVKAGSSLDVHFWRCVDSRKVWYEWCVSSPSPTPIHNSNGRSCWMNLY